MLSIFFVDTISPLSEKSLSSPVEDVGGYQSEVRMTTFTTLSWKHTIPFNLIVVGCIKKIRLLFSSLSVCIDKTVLRFREELLLFVFHTETFLCYKRLLRYKQKGFGIQILWFLIHLSNRSNQNDFVWGSWIFITKLILPANLSICLKIYSMI